MAEVGYASAVVLAAVFAWAGLAKLADRRRTASTFAALGLPAARLLARAVPAGELAAAAVLLVVPWVGAVAALVLLAGFSTLLAVRLRQGVRVSCGCFGSGGDQPLSGAELVRNGLLAAAAAVALAADRAVVPGLDAVIVATTAAAVGAMVVALAGVKRDLGVIWSNRLPGEAGR